MMIFVTFIWHSLLDRGVHGYSARRDDYGVSVVVIIMRVVSFKIDGLFASRFGFISDIQQKTVFILW